MDAPTIIENLAELQRLSRKGGRLSSEQKMAVTRIRVGIPAPFLTHFDRLVASGSKAVAEVHNGVCGGCHLRLPTTLATRSSAGEDVSICETCGAYLVFEPREAHPALAHAR